MATERQIAANRLNALKSTGPRTAANFGAQVTENTPAVEPISEPPQQVRIIDPDIAAGDSNDVRNGKISVRSQTVT